MKLKESYIVLQDLRFHAYHGVLPQERLTGNDYVVNLRIGYDIGDAMLSDDVNDTLNYAEVYQLVSQEMAVPSGLIDRLFRRFPKIEKVELKIIKQNPPMGADGDGAGIEVCLVRA